MTQPFAGGAPRRKGSAGGCRGSLTNLSATALLALLLASTAAAQGPAVCVVSGTVLDGGGSPVSGTSVQMKTVTPVLSGAFAISGNDLTTKTAADGTWSLTMVQGLNAQVYIPAAGISGDVTIPTGSGCPVAFSALTLHTLHSLTPATILSTTGPSMGGDLTGASPNPTVVGIRQQSVYSELCTNGQARVFDATSSSYRCASVTTGAAVTSVTAGSGISVTGGATTPVIAASAVPEASVTNLVSDLAAKLAIAGGTMSGVLTLAGDPAAALQAATKQYVDTGLATKLGTGGTITEAQVTGLVSDLAATEKTANKGVASGYAGLDGSGKVPAGQLPATMTPAAHAATHAIAGSDPVSPVSIGAANLVHTHAESDVTNLVTDLAAKASLAGLNTWTQLQTFNGGISVPGGFSPGGDMILTAGHVFSIPMAPPAAPSLTPSAGGGTLGSATYYYVVTALDGAGGQTTAGGELSTPVTGPTGSVLVSWTAIPGAASYRVYQGTGAGAEDHYLVASSNSLTDTGAAGTSATPPVSNTARTIRLSPTGDSWIANGNFGVGKANPATALDVNGTATATAFVGPLTGNVVGNVTGTASGNPTNARTIATTAPLAGGGDLSANRTLSVAITPANDGGAVALQAASPGTQQTGNLNLSGTIIAGTGVTGNLTGNASGSAGSFTGALLGDVTGTQGATVVSLVGASTAANVHAGELAANAATAANTPSTILKRDGAGQVAATTFTGNLSGNATTSSDGLSSASGTAPLTLSLAAKALTGSVAVMTGASGGGDGATGIVPKPLAGDNVKCLRGDATWAACSVGSVTSVGLSLPADFTISGSPVTTAGTLTATYASQLQNLGFFTPNGASGTPLFRKMVSQDIPSTIAADTTGTSASFTGNLTGDVTSVAMVTTVSQVAGSTAANVHSAELAANAATNLNTASTIVKRDASGNFTAGTITATINGTATPAAHASTHAAAGTDPVTLTEAQITNLTSDLAAKVPTTETVSTTAPLTGGGDLSAPRTLSIAITPANNGGAVALQSSTPGTAQTGNANVTGTVIAGGFTGPLTGNVTGNVTGNTSGSAGSFTGSLVGDVTGTQGATAVATVGTSSAANVHTAEVLANAATDADVNGTIVKRDGSGNFSATTVTAALVGNTSGTHTGAVVGNVTGNVSGSAASITGVNPIANGGTNSATAAGARANLSAAVLGANGDITSLTGLSTPLPVNEGGSGAATLTGLLRGNGTSAFTGASTASLTTEVSGILPVANGGTGTSTAFTPGACVIATTAGVYTQDAANCFYDLVNHRLGIGTNAPARALDVNGVIQGRGIAAPTASSAGNGTLYFDSGTNHWMVSENTGAAVPILSASGVTGTGANGQITYWNGATSQTGSTAFIADPASGRIGIGGVPAPAYAVDVAGDVNFSGVLRQAGNAIGHYAGGRNCLQFGVVSSFACGASQSNNTSFGDGALDSVSSPGNAAFGRSALHSAAAGTGFNSAFGNLAASALQNATGTAAFGSNACLTVTTGSANTCIGANADVSSATGTNRVALGNGVVANVDYGVALGDATNGLVGVRTGSPVVPLDVNGAIATRADASGMTLANGLNSNIGLTAYSFLKIKGATGAFSVGGFTNGTDGRILRLYNPLSQTMTIVNEDVSSTAANRITTLTGGNIVLRATAPSFATFIYDSAASRWIVTGTN